MNKKKIKKHLNDNRELYIMGGMFVGFACFTWYIMRDHSKLSIGRDVIVTAERDAIVLGQNNTLNTVSYIAADRQGPPSWVIQCLETQDVYTSQNKAAEALEITASNVSRQLNGLQENAQGYHFKRLCMAA